VSYFPAFFDLRGQRVLVVGAGEVALRKIALLDRAGASITVVAPHAVPEIEARARSGEIDLALREFRAEDLDGARLCVVATPRRAVNRWIAALCESRSVPVNVVDDRAASRFIVPAVIDRDPVLVAITTGGSSPVLARRLRERLEALIPRAFGELAGWLEALRTAARRKLRDTGERRRFFESLVDGPAARRFVEGDRRSAERIARRLLEATATSPRARGEVVLVGAGPGDPELLTLKALRALQDADIILHDRLVAPAILDLARRDAARISVGKTPGGESCAQEDIHALMIEHARAGKRVVRLKGGDPFVFGRGGEELEALAAAGIDFSVVPGITAAAGCAAYAGIPLTHREHAHTVSFVTGHASEEGPEPDWRALAAPGATAVFYMGLKRLDRIVAKLREHGAPAARPAALVAQGTTSDQRVVASTLAEIGEAARRARIEPPALLIVGDVAGLHPTLRWFNPATSEDTEEDRSRTAI
jgi:uroporphyrin-III C-methyltransferase/precorrin-2 dehydrogenase/sirohydrochlorin ferrochelatase